MKTSLQKRFLRAAGLALAAIALAPASMAAIIYQDNFNRSGALAGSAPTVTTNGATWTGGGTTSTTGGGQLSPGPGGWLPFSPTAGNIYTLSYTLNPNAAGTDDNLDIGFRNDTNARVAIFYQEIRSSPQQLMDLTVIHYDPTDIYANPDTSSIYYGTVQSPIADPALNSPTDYKIVLNTTNATWTAEFLWGGVSQTSVNLATTNITRITFDQWANGAGADVVTNFSLTSTTAVPEPGTFIPAAVLVAGALLRRRRSRSHRSGRATA